MFDRTVVGHKSLRIKQVDPDSTEQFVDNLGKWTEEVAKPRIRSISYPLVVSTASNASAELSAEVGTTFNLIQSGLLGFSQREASFLGTVMGETTGAAVAAAVQRGLEQGLTVSQLRHSIQQLPGFSRDRAQLVARTETTRAWNGAQQESLSNYARTQAVPAFKIWTSSRDARVRPEHVELDGVQVGINEEFPNGLMYPGEPNCRCTLIYGLAQTIVESPTPFVPEEDPVVADEPIDRLTDIRHTRDLGSSEAEWVVNASVTDRKFAHAAKDAIAASDFAEDYIENVINFAGMAIDDLHIIPNGGANGMWSSVHREMYIAEHVLNGISKGISLIKEGRVDEITPNIVTNFRTVYHELAHARSYSLSRYGINYDEEWGRRLEEGVVERTARKIVESIFGEGSLGSRGSYHGEVSFFDAIANKHGESAFDEIWSSAISVSDRLDIVGRYAKDLLLDHIRSVPTAIYPSDVSESDLLEYVDSMRNDKAAKIALKDWNLYLQRFHPNWQGSELVSQYRLDQRRKSDIH